MAKRAAGQPGTGGLAELIEEAKLDRDPVCLFGSPSRGLRARARDLAAWQEAYGHFGSLPQSHAWHVRSFHPSSPAGRCQPTLLTADTRCWGDHHRLGRVRCSCTGDLLYRGACCSCDWEGPILLEAPAAVEDAVSHAWPGWRELPIVPPQPPGGTRRDAWVQYVAVLYPAGWLTGGGPILTARTGLHWPGGTKFGGYDMAGSRPLPLALPEVT